MLVWYLLILEHGRINRQRGQLPLSFLLTVLIDAKKVHKVNLSFSTLFFIHRHLLIQRIILIMCSECSEVYFSTTCNCLAQLFWECFIFALTYIIPFANSMFICSRKHTSAFNLLLIFIPPSFQHNESINPNTSHEWIRWTHSSVYCSHYHIWFLYLLTCSTAFPSSFASPILPGFLYSPFISGYNKTIV